MCTTLNFVQDRASNTTQNSQLLHKIFISFLTFSHFAFFGIRKNLFILSFFIFSMRTELKRKFTIFSLWRAEEKIEKLYFFFSFLALVVRRRRLCRHTLARHSNKCFSWGFSHRKFFTRLELFLYSFLTSYDLYEISLCIFTPVNRS